MLWQLDTGKNQYLPHMGSTIQNVVVSPSGTSYGVQLADNSTMVLSTADLIPKANIAGLQSCVLTDEDSITAHVRRIEDEPLGSSYFQRTPAVISPTDPSRLLVGVGQLQEISHTKPLVTSTPFLQTFDLGSGHNVSRQALTRTNITSITQTPDANKISEPRVTHMQLSFDGKWLATVDEWTPPTRDVDFINHQGVDVDSERRHRREVFLKFWQWTDADQTWELVSRINDPHALEDSIGAPRILDLASDPSSLRFSTIGSDGLVRTWVTKTRKRDGVIVRGTDGSALRNWNCQHAISIGKTPLSDSSKVQKPIPNGSISFSEDGSLLAAACGGTGILHLLDPELGTIRTTHTRMYEGPIIALEFLAQDLITLSNHITVYDLVLDDLRYSVKLSPTITTLSVNQKTEMMHLSTDQLSRTFAVALPALSHSYSQTDTAAPIQEVRNIPLSSIHSELAIFTPDRSAPLLQEQFPSIITALLPAVGNQGYLVLDSKAQIRSVLRKGSMAVTMLAMSTSALNLDKVDDELVPDGDKAVDEDVLEEEMELMDVGDEEEEDEEKALGEGDGEDGDMDEDEENETPVVTQQQLSELFDIGPAFALPPLEEMFYRVADLFSLPPVSVG